MFDLEKASDKLFDFSPDKNFKPQFSERLCDNRGRRMLEPNRAESSHKTLG
jgi:hypothetical protein